MFRTWMNTSRVGRTGSRAVGRWDVEDIVEGGGRCEKSAGTEVVRKKPDLL
jgi:hypothetical protein